jgi:hypothetical protein
LFYDLLWIRFRSYRSTRQMATRRESVTPQPASPSSQQPAQSPSTTTNQTSAFATLEHPIPFPHAKSVVRVRPWIGKEASTIPEKQIVPRPALDHDPPSDTGLLTSVTVLDPLNKFKPKKGGQFSCDCVLWSFTDETNSPAATSPASPALGASPTTDAKRRVAPGIPASQADCYNVVGLPLVDCMMEGYNVACVVNGAAETGKFYSLIGDEYWSGESRGILPRFLFDMFERQQRTYREDRTSRVEVEAYAVSNDSIADLLRKPKSAQGEPELKVKEEGEKIIVVGGTVQEVEDLLALEPLLKVATQRYLKHHNTSHLVINIRVIDTWTFADPLMQEAVLKKERTSWATFVMMHGSHLGFQRCLEAAISRDSGEHPTAKIPARDSLLTRLCAEIFGGNCNVVHLQCVSPFFEHTKEASQSLTLATRLNLIKCNSKQNTDTSMNELRKLDDEVRGLQVEVHKTSEAIMVVQEEFDRRTETLREKQRIEVEHKNAYNAQEEEREKKNAMKDISLIRIKHCKQQHVDTCRRLEDERRYTRDEETSLQEETKALIASVASSVATVEALDAKIVEQTEETKTTQHQVETHEKFEEEVHEQDNIVKSSKERKAVINTKHEERMAVVAEKKKEKQKTLAKEEATLTAAVTARDEVKVKYDALKADQEERKKAQAALDKILKEEKDLQAEIKALEDEIKALEDEKAKQGCCTIS